MQNKPEKKFSSISTVFYQFNALDRALIDTSSLIYLSHINLLNIASESLQLMTVAGVVEEFGHSAEFEHIQIIEFNDIETDIQQTDQILIEIAKHFQLPVISEDKKILMQAKRTGLWFFNTLMIMNFLIYKKRISQTQYQAALKTLHEEAYYDAFIFKYGKKVFERIIENT